MTSKARNLVLTKSQAACLIALRRRKDSKPEIAIQAKLDLTKTATELGALARIGLARQNQSKRWHTTTSGKACRFKIVPDRLRRNSGLPGPGALRLLQLLDQPMRGGEIAEELGLSHQRVRQLVIKLHALSFRPSIIDCDISAFDVATFAESFVKSFESTGEWPRRLRAKIANDRYGRFLRM